MRRNSFFISWLVLIAGLLGSVRGGAVDVNSAEALRNVLGNATVNGNVVTLTDDVYLDRNSGGLSITGGTMVLDLNTYTLTYDRSSINASKGDDIAINVNGSSANITVKNGNIVTKSAKGTNSSGKFGDGGDGSNAFAIVLNDGLVAIIDVVMTVSPGAGGSGGSWVGSSGSAGGAWVIDANGSHTLENMLPAGTYFSKPTGVNYKEEGGGINQTAATVSLTQYNVIYNTNGGTTTIQGTPSYTIETSNFVLPTVAKNDYTFVDWTYNGNSVNPELQQLCQQRQTV